MRGYRWSWGPRFSQKFNFQWDIIDHRSFVVITASEGREVVEDRTILYTTESPNRFVGDARFTVDNIAPHDGGVTFHVTVDFWRPLMLWTDIIVFNELSFSLDGFHQV